MYWQLEYLREGVTATRNQTYRVDLPESGLLSALLVRITAPCTSGATLADDKWRLIDHLGTVEVVGNGATPIVSAKAVNLQYQAWLRQGIVVPHWWRNYATNTQYEYLLILFGRKMKDPRFGLDLSRYDNVELRITNTATSTYYSDDLNVSVLQLYKRDDPSGFAGYVRTELWRSWTTVSDETKYLTLPTDYPISGIHLRAVPPTTSGMANTGMANLADDVELALQGGVKRMIKGGVDDILIANWLERGAYVITAGQADVNADCGIPYGIGRGFGWAGISGSKDGAVSTVIPTAIADPTDGTISFEAREADSPIMFMSMGVGYHNSVYLHHNQDLEPEAMLDFRKDGEMKLNVHTRSGATYAGGAIDVVLERLVSS